MMGKKRRGKHYFKRSNQSAIDVAREVRHQEINRCIARTRNRNKILLIGGGSLGIILIIGLVLAGAISAAQPGNFDEFAQCLSEKGAVMYGAMATCKYTQIQKQMFGKSFKYLNYVEHSEFTGYPKITSTPTWVIDGKHYPKVQSFARLSALTGCQILDESNQSNE